MARPEVFYRLGDLLLHNGSERYAEARELFESAVALEPRHGLAWAGLGYLTKLEGEEAAALEHYAKAAKYSGESFLVQYLYGTCLVRSLNDRRPEDVEGQERLDRAVAALERATELQADFAPSWAELGYAWNLQPEASEKAVEVLEKAAHLLPARSDVAFNLLLAYARVGDRPGAGSAVDKLHSLGVDEATLGRAAEMLLQMDYRVAAQRVREKKLDDAIAIFARIRAETSDPALRQQVAEQLEKLEPKMQRDRFWELYNETVQLLHADRVEEAVTVVGKLLEVAKPGLQQKEARSLSQAVEFQRQAVAGSQP
jgi:Tfp pilus assembly protein PilF